MEYECLCNLESPRKVSQKCYALQLFISVYILLSLATIQFHLFIDNICRIEWQMELHNFSENNRETKNHKHSTIDNVKRKTNNVVQIVVTYT